MTIKWRGGCFPRKLSDAQRDDIIAQYQAGVPVKTIAAQFNISYTYVGILAGRMGVRGKRIKRETLLKMSTAAFRRVEIQRHKQIEEARKLYDGRRSKRETA